ncbi:MAG: TetR family transcriptional regulator [Nocardioidaceae bacterium]|nr:TetR family transcriptional regulator [Nocardioidaceae bacterium]
MRRLNPGRPDATTHAAIEDAAFGLFATRGFDGTTLDDIASAVGVGRRTLFRYYRSKNDIPWGQFDRTLDGFRRLLADMPEELSVHEAVHRGVLAFNEFPADSRPPHRDRMMLILGTPTLQAHSMLRYAEWREVIADYVAFRLRLSPSDVLPQVAGQVSLALALTAYDAWLADPAADLQAILRESMSALSTYLAE